MAKLRGIELDDGTYTVSFRVSKKEYEMFKRGDSHFLLVPLTGFRDKLTIGTLGNSYRIMLPKKFLKENKIPEEDLPRKADAGVFSIGEERFLAVRIGESSMKSPVFED